MNFIFSTLSVHLPFLFSHLKFERLMDKKIITNVCYYLGRRLLDGCGFEPYRILQSNF